ncbi:hypothetical protein JCM10207_006225 [Rhodosporidiobolus poonsookiae]
MAVPPEPPALDAALESYLLALLSDSNLPTGGFVASSGLEAWIQHGYLSLAPSLSTAAPADVTGDAAALLSFVAHSLHSYARLNAPFLVAAHEAVSTMRSAPPGEGASVVEDALDAVLRADNLCEAFTLNHVARRASVAQGGALLTLYDRAFAPPSSSSPSSASSAASSAAAPGLSTSAQVDARVGDLVRRYRARIRRTANPETYGAGAGKGEEGEERAYGHMSVAFAVLTAGVGMSCATALPLSLFLHARSLLSSAVRLNTVGPYAAHRMLLWDVRPLVDRAVEAVSGGMRDGTGEERELGEEEKEEKEVQEEDDDWWIADPFWAPLWADSPLSASHTPPRRKGADVGEPVTTWPLGEIVASRHDQLFSKVFNS